MVKYHLVICKLLPFVCTKCRKNYCIRHRNEIDHECNEIPNTGENKEINSKRLFNIFQRQQQQEQPRASQTNQRASNAQRSSQSRPSGQARQPNSMVCYFKKKLFRVRKSINKFKKFHLLEF